MKVAMFGVMVFAAASLVGCSSDSAALAKAKAEAEAAKAEAAAAKTELALLKAQLAALDGKIKDQQSEEGKVMEVGKEFIQLLRANRSDKAYELTTAAFQKKMYPLGLPGAPEIRASDPLLKKYPGIRTLERTEDRQHKVKKSPDGKAYEYFCYAREFNPRGSPRPLNIENIDIVRDAGKGPWMEFTLTIIQDGGAWKVDKLEVQTEVP